MLVGFWWKARTRQGSVQCIINPQCVTYLVRDDMESQNTEWKESWKDEYLKTICAFANTEGGMMTLGVNDQGKIVGVSNPEKLLKQLPDKIRSKLGIVPFIRIDTESPPYTITILVQKAPTTVNLDGKFYIRSGSTTQMISGRELELYMMERAGDSWTEVPVPGVSVMDLSPESIMEFKNLVRIAGRLSKEELDLGPEDAEPCCDLVVSSQSWKDTRSHVIEDRDVRRVRSALSRRIHRASDFHCQSVRRHLDDEVYGDADLVPRHSSYRSSAVSRACNQGSSNECDRSQRVFVACANPNQSLEGRVNNL